MKKTEKLTKYTDVNTMTMIKKRIKNKTTYIILLLYYAISV